jgi:hypothetical protein
MQDRQDSRKQGMRSRAEYAVKDGKHERDSGAQAPAVDFIRLDEKVYLTSIAAERQEGSRADRKNQA